MAGADLVDERAHRELPRDAISLAINSIEARSQNQFHIHIDCVRLDVQAALREHAADIGPQWSPFPVPLAGHNYLAMRLTQRNSARPIRSSCWPTTCRARATICETTPWSLSAQPMALCCSPVMRQASAIAAHGEELQDHACAAAH